MLLQSLVTEKVIFTHLGSHDTKEFLKFLKMSHRWVDIAGVSVEDFSMVTHMKNKKSAI